MMWLRSLRTTVSNWFRKARKAPEPKITQRIKLDLGGYPVLAVSFIPNVPALRMVRQKTRCHVTGTIVYFTYVDVHIRVMVSPRFRAVDAMADVPRYLKVYIDDECVAKFDNAKVTGFGIETTAPTCYILQDVRLICKAKVQDLDVAEVQNKIESLL
jgi:hypothetical protein